jgi:glucose-6-phosphate dehydrogenase assembly protein OpcA
MAQTLRNTSVEEIEGVLDQRRDHEDAAQRTSVATHMAWVPEEWARAADRVVHGLGSRIPSRTLILRPEPGAKKDGIDATIDYEHFPHGPTGVCVEIVRIRLRGRTAHWPASVVVPLQLPDLPVFLRWRGRPPFGRPQFGDLVGAADRLIVDTVEWDRVPSGLASLTEEFDRVVVSDLSWARTLRWRASLAGLWPEIKKAKALHVVGPRVEAMLLRAWLRARLRREFRLSHETAGDLTRVEVDGEALVPARGLPETPADLLSAELESLVRDPVYEAAVRAV